MGCLYDSGYINQYQGNPSWSQLQLFDMNGDVASRL